MFIPPPDPTLPLIPLPSDLAEAQRYLSPQSADSEIMAFARRQLAARRRLTTVIHFYGFHSCRMARIHRLTSAAVTLGRFCGFSHQYDQIGAAVMPADDALRPRTEAWRLYAEACLSARPVEFRDELWITAHLDDMQEVRRAGYDAAFERELATHADDPTWQLLHQHMQLTLGARLMDHSALAGAVANETAMAQGMATSLRRMARGGLRLLCRYAAETARAAVVPHSEPPRGLVSYRRTAVELMRTSVTAWTAAAVFRRGIRMRDRGRRATDDAWPLLAEVLGDRQRDIHPAIVAFYANPSRFRARARVELYTLPARFWSRVAALLLGQGAYEDHAGDVDVRFGVFRRRDGSMHFLRELWVGDRLRVFDSDFVVRRIEGKPTLYEVFVESHLDVEMELRPLPDGALSIRGRRVFYRGVRLPQFGLRVEFTSRVVDDSGEVARLEILGRLLMQPDTALGRWLAHRVLRRPHQLGSIRYDVEGSVSSGPRRDSAG